MLSNLIADAIHVQTAINNIIICVIHALWSVCISNFLSTILPSAVNVNLSNPITCLNRYFSLVRVSIGLDRFHCIIEIFLSVSLTLVNRLHIYVPSHMAEISLTVMLSIEQTNILYQCTVDG